MFAEPLIELTRNTANGRFIANVGRAESTGSQAANLPSRFEQRDRFPHSFRLDGGGDSASGSTINADIELDLLGLETSHRAEEKNKDASAQFEHWTKLAKGDACGKPPLGKGRRRKPEA